MVEAPNATFLVNCWSKVNFYHTYLPYVVKVFNAKIAVNLTKISIRLIESLIFILFHGFWEKSLKMVETLIENFLENGSIKWTSMVLNLQIIRVIIKIN